MMPDIDTDIYTKVVDLEESFILICILYIRYNRKLSKKVERLGNELDDRFSTPFLTIGAIDSRTATIRF